MEKKKQDVKKKAATKTAKTNKKVKTDKVQETKKIKNVNKVKFETAEQEELKKFLGVVIVVLLCVVAVYLCTRAFITKDLFTKKEPKTEEVVPGAINYEVTIMGELFTKPESEYYVAIYNTLEGEYSTDMYLLVYDYTDLEKHKAIYTVDLSNELFNGAYYDPENVNLDAKTLEEIKVGDATLIKIKENKKTGEKEINKYITDIDAMKKELGIE